MTGIEGPVLATERLVLRPPRAGDWEPWRAFAMSERARFVGGPYTLGGAWRGFCHIVGMWLVRGFGSFVFTGKGSGAPLGMTGPWYPADWPEREIGWTVWDPAAEGRGLAFEAATAARDFAFRDLGWTTAVSYVARDNHRSIALAERLGAVEDDAARRPEGHDCLVFRHRGDLS